MTDELTRRVWQRYEIVHDVVYFSEESLQRFAALGLKGFWMGYFAQRAAPLGLPRPATVTATFFGFHARRVQRALPDAWQFTTPAQALAARLEGVDAALRALIDVDDPAHRIPDAADLLWEASQAADCAGRALAGANQALPRPDAPHLALWQAATTLREHRGDGHLAVLVTRGIDPVAAHLIKSAAGESVGETLRVQRGFSDEEWAAGTDALTARGWLDADGGLTEAGRAEHRAIEDATDAAARQPWDVLGPDRTAHVFDLLDPIATRFREAGLIPEPSPVGLQWT